MRMIKKYQNAAGPIYPKGFGLWTPEAQEEWRQQHPNAEQEQQTRNEFQQQQIKSRSSIPQQYQYTDPETGMTTTRNYSGISQALQSWNPETFPLFFTSKAKTALNNPLSKIGFGLLAGQQLTKDFMEGDIIPNPFSKDSYVNPFNLQDVKRGIHQTFGNANDWGQAAVNLIGGQTTPSGWQVRDSNGQIIEQSNNPRKLDTGYFGRQLSAAVNGTMVAGAGQMAMSPLFVRFANATEALPVVRTVVQERKVTSPQYVKVEKNIPYLIDRTNPDKVKRVPLENSEFNLTQSVEGLQTLAKRAEQMFPEEVAKLRGQEVKKINPYASLSQGFQKWIIENPRYELILGEDGKPILAGNRTFKAKDKTTAGFKEANVSIPLSEEEYAPYAAILKEQDRLHAEKMQKDNELKIQEYVKKYGHEPMPTNVNGWWSGIKQDAKTTYTTAKKVLEPVRSKYRDAVAKAYEETGINWDESLNTGLINASHDGVKTPEWLETYYNNVINKAIPLSKKLQEDGDLVKVYDGWKGKIHGKLRPVDPQKYVMSRLDSFKNNPNIEYLGELGDDYGIPTEGASGMSLSNARPFLHLAGPKDYPIWSILSPGPKSRNALKAQSAYSASRVNPRTLQPTSMKGMGISIPLIYNPSIGYRFVDGTNKHTNNFDNGWPIQMMRHMNSGVPGIKVKQVYDDFSLTPNVWMQILNPSGTKNVKSWINNMEFDPDGPPIAFNFNKSKTNNLV